jgi:hypothetical protein
VTGDAPQPGETPRTEGNPWSFDPDAAWWRGDGDREQAEALAEVAARPRQARRRPGRGAPTPNEPGNPLLGETVDAHAAGAQDAAAELRPARPEAPAGAEGVQPAEAAGAGPAGAEPAAAEPSAGPDAPAARANPPAVGPDDVMVLPEPTRNRRTRTVEPGRAAGVTGNPARRESEPDVKRSRIEDSPFWLTDEERAAAANPASADRPRETAAANPADRRPARPVRREPRSPRRAAPGLLGLIALGLIAAFFSWVSAEPFWLAVGHGDRGTATVAQCVGSGVTQRCTGSFTAADGRYGVRTVRLLGVDPAARTPGSTRAARMVDSHSRQAYVGDTGLLLHLRWVLGFVLVLLCGLGIAGLTGTRQLETVRARRTALVMSLAGPLILLAGFLLAAA